MIHPREYLSYSAMTLWEKDPEEFKAKYFYPETYVPHTNRGQAKGRQMHEAIENDEETGELDIDIVVAQMPKYEIRDKEITVKLSVGHGKQRSFIPILMKPDSVRKDFKAFYEYKQGTAPWTQAKVDEDDQITFYTAGLYLKVKSMCGVEIPTAELIYAPTEKKVDDDGIERPHLTGVIHRFPTTRSFAEVLRMHARMSTAWREIGQAMESEII